VLVSQKTPKLVDPIEKVFPIGRKIDLAFNLESLHPTVRSTIIHECDYRTKSMILSQTNPKILPNLNYKKMEMTTLVGKQKGGTLRLGIGCDIINFESNYQLSAGQTEAAFIVRYALPLKKTNIRGAYRIQPNPKYDIKGKLIYNNTSVVADREFKIHDISATGIGIPAAKIVNNKRNPLFYLEKGNQVECEIILSDALKNKKIKIRACIKIVRIQNLSNRTRSFIGGKYMGIDPNDNENLFQFIHSAQTYEIRNMLMD